MNRSLRLWSYGVFLAVCVAFVWVAPPTDEPASELPGWTDSNPHHPFWEEEWERQRTLDDQVAASQRRLWTQERIVEQVIAQQLSLLEAAAQWGAVLEENPGINWEFYRGAWPANSDAERYCRNVIDAVQCKLRREPGRAAALTGALEAELRGHLEQGTLRLPSRSGGDGDQLRCNGCTEGDVVKPPEARNRW
jgi:hypothetical protein